jgi:hypothetical protein
MRDSSRLSVLERNVLLITTPPRPPAFRVLIKCCKFLLRAEFYGNNVAETIELIQFRWPVLR